MSQTMTIPELASAAGCNEKTVRTIGKKLFPDLFRRGKRVAFQSAEALTIMQSLPKKNMVKVGKMSEDVRTVIAEEFRKMIPEIIRMTVTATMTAIESRAPKQLETPKMKPRNEISRIVRSYANAHQIDYNIAWKKFYQECYYRLNKNFYITAGRQGVTPLDLIEEGGYIEEALLVARDWANEI